MSVPLDGLEAATLPWQGDEDAQEWFAERDLTDGLPVVIPTRQRVERFIAESGFEPEAVAGIVDPRRGVATVANVAVNALMAGCRPQHLGVVLGAVEAMTQPPFNLHGVQTTTNPATPVVLVNGPVRSALNVDSGRNALSPGRHANGVIGRAVRLVMRNIGGAVGDVDRSTLGSPMKYTFCLAEAEEQSPWPPLHTALGFAPSDSAVTVVAVESFINMAAVFQTAEALIEHYVRAMRASGTSYYFSRSTLLLVVSPGHARILAAEGYDRRALQERLFEDAKLPVGELRSGNIPQGRWTVVDGRILITEKPEDIYVVVAGGPEPLHTVFMPGFVVSSAASARVWQPGERRAAA